MQTHPTPPVSDPGDPFREWLERVMPKDALWAEAYEQAGAPGRARFKLCIARLHACWGERDPRERTTVRHRQGFALEAEMRPAPYSLIVCPSDYPHAEGLLAAFMPAVLAGVPLILPCLAGQGLPEGIGKDLLAALELAGAEECVLADGAAVLQGLSMLYASLGIGRLVLLEQPQGWKDLALWALERGMPVLSLKRERTAFSADAFHQGVWAWPELGPDWFRTRALTMTG